MPIPGEHFDVLGINLSQQTAQAEDKNERKQNEPRNHVRGMQPDERIEGRAEEIRADRQVMTINQPVPFESRPGEERYRQGNRYEPPQFESPGSASFKRALSQDDRRA